MGNRILQRKVLLLRGVSDHELLFNQKIHLLRKLFRIQFCEHGSKYNQSGVQKQSLTVKSVTINAVPGSHHCHVKIFQPYLSHVPPMQLSKIKFCLQPVDSPKHGEYWYYPKPLAVNKLKNVVNRMLIF